MLLGIKNSFFHITKYITVFYQLAMPLILIVAGSHIYIFLLLHTYVPLCSMTRLV